METGIKSLRLVSLKPSKFGMILESAEIIPLALADTLFMLGQNESWISKGHPKVFSLRDHQNDVPTHEDDDDGDYFVPSKNDFWER